MIKLTIDLPPYSKPRGQLGKHGNMTHSSGLYREWQLSFKRKLRSLYPKVFPEFFCLIYILQIKTNKLGRSQDCDNMIGGINDCLTDGWLRDDSWRDISHFWVEAIPGKKGAIILYICETKWEFLQVFIELYINKAFVKFSELRELVTK